MFSQFITIGILMLLATMLPGPDFAMVTRNTLTHSRRAGLFTSFGVGASILVHITYCALGLAIVISQSILLFNIIKYIGAAYLIYMGISALLAKKAKPLVGSTQKAIHKTTISNFKAFQQGLLCNLLNPKATLFFLALFTAIIKPGTPVAWVVAYALEMFLIITLWFCCLTMLLSHPKVIARLSKAESAISKFLGVFLIGFGIALAFVKQH